MADTKISDLAQLDTPIAGDRIAIVDTSAVATKYLDFAEFTAGGVNASHYSAVAGAIDISTELQAALDAVDTAGGGRVILEPSTSNYTISGNGTVAIPTGVTFDINSQNIDWTFNTANTSAKMIQVKPGSRLINGTLNNTGANTSGQMIELDGADQFGKGVVAGGAGKLSTVVRDLRLAGTSTSDSQRGITLRANASSEYVQYCLFQNIIFDYVDQAIRIEANTGTTECFVNANHFEHLFMDYVSYGVLIKGETGAPEVRGNLFRGIQYQTRAAESFRVLDLEYATGNRFEGMCVWDWAGEEGANQMIDLNIGAVRNYINIEMSAVTNWATLVGGAAENDNIVMLNARAYDGPQTLPVDDTTPSVANGYHFKTANTIAFVLPITTFDDALVGREILVEIGDSNTTFDFTGSTLKGNGGVDWSPAIGDFMVARYDGTNWLCTVVET